MTFQIYVGKRENSRGEVELSLRFRCGRVDQQATANIWIAPGLLTEEIYVSEKGRRSRRTTIPDDMPELKDLMGQMISYIEDCFMFSRRRGVTRGWLADIIDRFHEKEAPGRIAERKDVLGLIDEFLDSTCRLESSCSRTEAYSLLRRSVARFEEFRRIKLPRFKLTVSCLNDVCLKEFEIFMRKEHFWVGRYPLIVSSPDCTGRTRAKSQNTVNDRLKLLKAVMNWAVRTRRIPYNPFDNFVKGQNVYGTPVYLSIDERRKIERLNLSRCPRLELQRDIFIFQCCVGCRVSDLEKLTKSNIVDGELNYVARKTREGRPLTIRVPLNSTAQKILDRYSDSGGESLFPKIYSRVGYNNYIKRIMRLAGVTRKVLVINPLTRESESHQICEVASSHIARRTFIGNIYKKFKDQGLVSELSGHSPGSRAFARYREIDLDMKREMVRAID